MTRKAKSTMTFKNGTIYCFAVTEPTDKLRGLTPLPRYEIMVAQEHLLYREAEEIMRNLPYLPENCTQLAEEAAHRCKHPEWLDDPDHWIWDMALEEGEELGIVC